MYTHPYSTLYYFYPRPPRGGRLFLSIALIRITNISIHVLREEDDLPAIRYARGIADDFYPRPPRGGRLGVAVGALLASVFLSTSSARRTTTGPGNPTGGRAISIHVLREEDDPLRNRRTEKPSVISIHVLREEDDRPFVQGAHKPDYFYPRPPRGGRHRCGRRCADGT